MTKIEELVGMPASEIIGKRFTPLNSQMSALGWKFVKDVDAASLEAGCYAKSPFSSSTYMRENKLVVITLKRVGEYGLACVCVTVITPGGTLHHGGQE